MTALRLFLFFFFADWRMVHSSSSSSLLITHRIYQPVAAYPYTHTHTHAATDTSSQWDIFCLSAFSHHLSFLGAYFWLVISGCLNSNVNSACESLSIGPSYSHGAADQTSSGGAVVWCVCDEELRRKRGRVDAVCLSKKRISNLIPSSGLFTLLVILRVISSSVWDLKTNASSLRLVFLGAIIIR